MSATLWLLAGSQRTAASMTAMTRFGFAHSSRLEAKQEREGQILPFTINNLWDNDGARRKAKIVGRGPGSGKGKTAGKGHKGQYARSGGSIAVGFEGGQSAIKTRFPKVGFRPHRFNKNEDLEQVNLGKLAYHIEKGHLDTEKPITMRHLLEAGVTSKIGNGVKLLNKGSERFSELKVPITMEVADASGPAIEAVKSLGGSLKVIYRTPMILKQHLKPHKFSDHKALKTPMPPPKKVKKLEALRHKGLDVDYPDAPWFTNNQEKIQRDAEEKAKRISSGAGSDLVPFYPASREPTPDRVRTEKDPLEWKFKL